MAGYLKTRAELRAHLRPKDGSGVEQWIATRVDDGFRFIKWLRIVWEEGEECCVYEKRSLDVGDESYIDMDEFEEIEGPDSPEGRRAVFETAEEALQFAERVGAIETRFVPIGDIQEIYREFFLQQGPPLKGIREWIIPCG